MSPEDHRIVYSTDHGRVCPECGEPDDDCRCGTQSRSTPDSGTTNRRVRVQRSTKGRKGKTVSVISGLELNAFEIAELAKELKQRCGAGGTAKNDVIEIQGDHVENIVRFLCARGFDAK